MSRHLSYKICFVISVLCLSNCNRLEDEPPIVDLGAAKEFRVEDMAAPTVRSSSEHLAFRFLDRATGTMRVVTSIEEVPEDVREAVIVMDLDTSRASHPRALFVCNLNAKQEDGTFPVKVLDRFAFENSTVAALKPESMPPGEKSDTGSVVMYSAEWCGACKQAAKWLRAQNIPFRERDVEKDSRALPDLAEAARKAGMTERSIGGSVPVFVVEGAVLKGFQPQAILGALGKN